MAMAILSTYWPALVGGMLIGAAAGGFHLVEGRIAGISGIAGRALAGPDRGWRCAFLAGLVAVGLIAKVAGGTAGPALGAVPLPLSLAAGLLVGLGSGIGSGCTSGHGVCGLARLSRRSIVAVCIFMATASATVWFIRHGGA